MNIFDNLSLKKKMFLLVAGQVLSQVSVRRAQQSVQDRSLAIKNRLFANLPENQKPLNQKQ